MRNPIDNLSIDTLNFDHVVILIISIFLLIFFIMYCNVRQKYNKNKRVVSLLTLRNKKLVQEKVDALNNPTAIGFVKDGKLVNNVICRNHYKGNEFIGIIPTIRRKDRTTNKFVEIPVNIVIGHDNLPNK